MYGAFPRGHLAPYCRQAGGILIGLDRRQHSRSPAGKLPYLRNSRSDFSRSCHGGLLAIAPRAPAGRTARGNVSSGDELAALRQRSRAIPNRNQRSLVEIAYRFGEKTEMYVSVLSHEECGPGIGAQGNAIFGRCRERRIGRWRVRQPFAIGIKPVGVFPEKRPI